MDARLARLVRPHLRTLPPYEAVDPPAALAQRAGVPLERVIKLNGNENPYGCSPRVRQALSEYSSYHIYPDSEQRRVRRALAQYVGLSEEHLLAGSGADEMIDLLMRLVLEPGDRVLNCTPTFGMYPFVTHVCGGEIVEVARDEAFQVDVEACLEALDSRMKAVFLASPNNPTGNSCPPELVEQLLATGILVVVDETYYEFSGETMAPQVPHHPNLAVLRSLSKWAGLAGLRVGYGVFPAEVTKLLLAMKPPYNLNAAAEVALLVSLEDAELLHQHVRAIIQERERMVPLLEQLPGVKVWPGEGNFVLCQFPRGRAPSLFEGLAQRGIFVRYFNAPRLEDCLRIGVGLPEHTDALVAALGELV